MGTDFLDFVSLRTDFRGFDPTLKKTLIRNLFFGVKQSRSRLRLRFLIKRWTLEQCRASQRFQKASGYWLPIAIGRLLATLTANSQQPTANS